MPWACQTTSRDGPWGVGVKEFVKALCHTSRRHALVLISSQSNVFSQTQLGSAPLFLYILIYTANITHWVNGWNIFLLQQSVLTLNPHWRLIYSSFPPVFSKSLMVNYGGVYEKSPPYRPNRDKSSRTSPFAWKKKWPPLLQIPPGRRKTTFCNKCKRWKEGKKVCMWQRDWFLWWIS